MPSPTPNDRSRSERALPDAVLVDSADCQICGTRLTGKQRRVCSPKCRAALSRQTRAQERERAVAERDAAMWLLLTTALEAVSEARDRLKEGGTRT